MINLQFLSLFLLLLTTAIISYIKEVYSIEPQLMNTFYWSFNLFFIFCWTIAHALSFKLKPPYLRAVLCGAFPPVGLPVYFYSSFGFKQGSIKILKALGFLLLLILVSVIFESLGKN